MLGLVAVQLGDGVFNAIPNQWLIDDLDHLGFPQDLRFIFPVIKSGSAVGLLVGLKQPRIGQLTALALITYFVAAIAFHARARDKLPSYVPAAAMLVWSTMALRAYRLES